MKVWTIPHTAFAAQHLVNQINKIGIKCCLVNQIDVNDSDIYIIYGAVNCPRLPKNYIVYQTEIKGSHFFNFRYLQILKNAMAVWEYSDKNIGAYRNKNISIVSPGIIQQPKIKKDIPVLFYGWINGSSRREKILCQLSAHVNIKIVTNITGPEMWNILHRAKIVLNIHYYDHSPVERFRINEAISHNCMVISEKTEPIYDGLIDCSYNIEQMILKIWEKQKENFKWYPGFYRLDNYQEIKTALSVIG